MQKNHHCFVDLLFENLFPRCLKILAGLFRCQMDYSRVAALAQRPPSLNFCILISFEETGTNDAMPTIFDSAVVSFR